MTAPHQETTVLSTLGKVPLDAEETEWVTVQVVFNATRGGNRVRLILDASDWMMGSDSAAALSALLRVADEKCREAAEYQATHNPQLRRYP